MVSIKIKHSIQFKSIPNAFQSETKAEEKASNAANETMDERKYTVKTEAFCVCVGILTTK